MSKKKAKAKKRRNMQDVPLSYYQALRRDVQALKKRVKALEEWKRQLCDVVHEHFGLAVD